MGLWDSGYTSGSATNIPDSWTKMLSMQSQKGFENMKPKSTSPSYWPSRTLDDVMKEFQMNGVDSPYEPEDLNMESVWGTNKGELPLTGLGPSGTFLRQQSCSEPPCSPGPQVRPRSHSVSMPTCPDTTTLDGLDSPVQGQYLTQSQAQVLASLPDAALYSLLREMQHERRNKMVQECRFCKNNGEREWYYSSHTLKDAVGRVTCPVLRALVCRRCGARGDNAHTIKYCPFSTNEERIKSSAIMRSVRMSSGKRRHSYVPTNVRYAFCETTPSIDDNNNYVYSQMPLEPHWAALEKKLILPKERASCNLEFLKYNV